MNIQDQLTGFALLGAEWVMWLLIGLSIVGTVIVLERAYVLVASREDVGRLHRDLLSRIERGDMDGVRDRLSSSKSYEAKVVHAVLEGAAGGADAAEERMASASALARLRMERNLAFLGTVGNNAPFVGLLGTVIGVINAFRELEHSGGTVSQGLMTQIGEALVATAVGILVALPAVAFFNLFQRAISGRLTRAEALARDLLAQLKVSVAARLGDPGAAE